MINKIINVLPDNLYISLKYFYHFKKLPNLKNPKRYTEKIQWLKLHDRKQEYTKMVDKYLVKDYVASIIGEEYIIPTLGVWENAEDIEFDKLPNKFVLKWNHDSGSVVICKDKTKLNRCAVVAKLAGLKNHNGFNYGREWPYKNVKPLIIAEEYMEDEGTKELRDYKFFTFDGVARAIFIASDRQNESEDTKFDFFDMEYNHLPFTNGHPNAKIVPEKPINFELMKKLAEQLSKGIPHVRVDFYEVNGKVYFGEMTFAHWSGFMPFDPEEWDYKFGEWLLLPDNY